ncbi:pyrF [Symbiodinium microadriaticum]|nr:pyrF [Symbiodinium microadriaticum]
MDRDEVDTYIERLEAQESISVAQAVTGIISPDELTTQSRRTYEEYMNWSQGRQRQIRNEEFSARHAERETRRATKMIELREKGILSDEALILYGISGPLPDRSTYLTMSNEDKEHEMDLVVALDLPTPEENLALVDSFMTWEGQADGAPMPNEAEIAVDCWLKVGLNTFIAGGPEFVKELKHVRGFKVVLDLKLYDIPNTCKTAAQRIAELGVDMFTVHASAGHQALMEMKHALNSIDGAPKMLAVTVLTSFSHEGCQRVYGQQADETVDILVKESVNGLADGVVCSVLDVGKIDTLQLQTLEQRGPQPPLVKFCPGIRLEEASDDQKRKGGLYEALMGGADFVVVGRPIYQAENPLEVATKIVGKIRDMEEKLTAFKDAAKWE